jgi:hypothetical protein
MSKQYIGKALTYLSKRRQAEGPQLCDKIAAILTDMPSAKVNALNSSLNFGWLRWQMRGVDIVIGETRGDRADKRRSAMLLVTCAKSAWIKEINDAQSWDDNVLDEVIGRYFNGQRSLPDIQGTGYYLKGSYWAFSNHSDREFTKAAWKEAVQMVQRGIEAASHNQAFVTRWFGTADGNKVLENLQKIQTSMTTKRIGICYHGLNGCSLP